jgi:hypothetical protein
LEDDTEMIIFDLVLASLVQKHIHRKQHSISHEHRTQENDTIKLGNRSFENVANLIYLEAAVRGQSCIIEVMKNGLNLDNACCHSVH